MEPHRIPTISLLHIPITLATTSMTHPYRAQEAGGGLGIHKYSVTSSSRESDAKKWQCQQLFEIDRRIANKSSEKEIYASVMPSDTTQACFLPFVRSFPLNISRGEIRR